MPTIYVRNVSSGNNPITIAPFTFGSSVEIAGFNKLPKTGPAIVYIVAHAVPNGLATGEHDIINELKIAEELTARENEPTLVIFDACFAKSFALIPGFSWPDKFGLIFSCLEYERAWTKPVTGSARQSLFSDAIDHAMGDYKENRSLSGLRTVLSEYFGDLQTPSVQATDELLHEVLGLSARKATSSAAE